jgi:hypothetical protein
MQTCRIGPDPLELVHHYVPSPFLFQPAGKRHYRRATGLAQNATFRIVTNGRFAGFAPLNHHVETRKSASRGILRLPCFNPNLG